MAPDHPSKPRSCPEPVAKYLGFERKSSQPVQAPVPHTPRPLSLLSLQLAPKVLDDLRAEDDSECSDFDDDETNSVDSLDPSQCASLSSFEMQRELMSNSQDSSSTAPRHSESQIVDEYSFLASPDSCFHPPRNVTISSEIDIPASASMMAQQRYNLRQVIYKQQVSQMLAACTEYQRSIASKEDPQRSHCGSA